MPNKSSPTARRATLRVTLTGNQLTIEPGLGDPDDLADVGTFELAL